LIDFQLLWFRVRIDATKAHPSAAEVLSFLVQNAHQDDLEPTRTLQLEVADRGCGFQLREFGSIGQWVADSTELLDAVYQLVHQRVFDEATFRGRGRLHSATFDLGSTRCLLVGPSGAGKTTLSCALVLNGIDVQADENTFIRGGVALPLPRPFHLKAGMEHYVPCLREHTGGLPAVREGAVRAWCPRVDGPWTIDKRRVDLIVFIRRDAHSTRAERIWTASAFGSLLEHSYRGSETIRPVVRELATVLRNAPAFSMTWRTAVEAVDQLQTLIKSGPTTPTSER